MKKFIFKILLIMFLATGVSWGIDVIYRLKYHREYPLPVSFLPHRAIKEKYQIVKLGNSHSQAGITFKGYKLNGLDLTGVAQRFSFDLALLKQHAQQIDDQALIIINASPISFSHRPANRYDGLQYNYYGRLNPFLIPDLIVEDYLRLRLFSLFDTVSTLRKDYAVKVTDRISLEERSPELDKKPQVELAQASKTNAPTKILKLTAEEYYFNVDVIKAELTSPSAIANEKYIDNMNFIFNKWYHTEEFNSDYFAGNRHDLEELIVYCLEKNWRPVLITVPVSQILEDGLLDDYKQIYLYDNLFQTDFHGVEYFDFTQNTQFTSNLFLFANADHINDKGAAVFSYILLQKLIEKGYLNPEADGYDYRPFFDSQN